MVGPQLCAGGLIRGPKFTLPGASQVRVNCLKAHRSASSALVAWNTWNTGVPAWCSSAKPYSMRGGHPEHLEHLKINEADVNALWCKNTSSFPGHKSRCIFVSLVGSKSKAGVQTGVQNLIVKVETYISCGLQGNFQLTPAQTA